MWISGHYRQIPEEQMPVQHSEEERQAIPVGKQLITGGGGEQVGTAPGEGALHSAPKSQHFKLESEQGVPMGIQLWQMAPIHSNGSGPAVQQVPAIFPVTVLQPEPLFIHMVVMGLKHFLLPPSGGTSQM
mgnify:CR=1 FL=1